ncbi:hypothetical protein G7Y89_g14052 [Cudoniella acicularis]|uniref:BTB domain-containing protein n=1 Tax=Cudoniella acicularis TaxID=354080 RepID=A0A8H4VXM6_9HELO|nr:hypothetical protein G7Y89_g14052 [Cudoniella acicularis]
MVLARVVARPSKRSPKTNNKPLILTYNIPGQKPDVRLQVLEAAELYVHLFKLKIHSRFFMKFLDSLGKADKSKQLYVRIYNFIHLLTVKECELEWDYFTGFVPDILDAFQSLLNAIYNQSYSVSVNSIIDLTELADYYCTLPAVSCTLDKALQESPNLINELLSSPKQNLQILVCSIKLQNHALYEDSLTFAFGPWSQPSWHSIVDKLKMHVRNKNTKLSAKVALVQDSMLRVRSAPSVCEKNPGRDEYPWNGKEIEYPPLVDFDECPWRKEKGGYFPSVDAELDEFLRGGEEIDRCVCSDCIPVKPVFCDPSRETIMAEPTNKKQKTEQKPEVVVYKVQGLKPNVRLKVFDSIEFHVHSVVLKMHSGFFRTFLDSADKQNKSLCAQDPFEYEWVTKVDDNGKGWHLVDQFYTQGEEKDQKEFKGPSDEICIFRTLLDAMYNQPYTITVKRLLRLTDLADYYSAFPIVSRTLDGAFIRSDSFYDFELMENKLALLPAAVKLRNKLLYKTCLTLCTGPWKVPDFKKIEEKNLRNLAEIAYNRVGAEIMKLDAVIIYWSELDQGDFTHPNYHEELFRLAKDQRALTDHDTVVDGELGVSFPKLYRSFFKSNIIQYSDFIAEMLLVLLRSELALCRDFKAGKGHCSDYFLNVHIPDDELPWNLKETEW